MKGFARVDRGQIEAIDGQMSIVDGQMSIVDGQMTSPAGQAPPRIFRRMSGAFP
jgi:hypothetical protein